MELACQFVIMLMNLIVAHFAFETHASSMPFLGQAPVFDDLREQLEIQQIVRDAGLPV